MIVYENYYILYGFFTGLLFVFLFYHPTRKNFILLISIPFLFLSVKKIYQAHDTYKYRVAYMDRLVKNAKRDGEKKCIVDSKCYPDNYAGAEWNFAFETLLYSSLPGPDSSITVFIKSPEFYGLCDSNKDRMNIFLGVHFSPLWFGSNSIPDKYFRLPSTGYNYLTNPQDDSEFHENVFSNQNVKIIPVEQTIYASLNDWLVVAPLKIENTSGQMIPAIPRSKKPVKLTYRLYDEKGKRRTDNLPTPFETDIKNGSLEGLIIYLPFEKGTFYARPDIITGDKKWWNLSSSLIKIVIK